MAEALHWLRNPHLEAGFSVQQGIRLESLRRPGGDKLLRESSGPIRGLKTWIMMPSDIPGLRDMLSEEPAELVTNCKEEIRLQTSRPNKWGLLLEWVARLTASGDAVQLTQRLHHRGQDRLYLGLWTIAALPEGTILRLPFARSSAVSPEFPNQVAVFPYTNLGDPRITSTPEALEMAIRKGRESESIKLGLVQLEGRVEAVRGDQVLVMRAPYLAYADYPEGGMNVTVYASPADGKEIFGEAELVGPLQLLEPGAVMELPVTIGVGNNWGRTCRRR